MSLAHDPDREYVALDCEFKVDNYGNRLVKQVAIVNSDYDVIYEWDDTSDIPFETVRKDVRRILHKKCVIGHELVNDLLSFGLEPLYVLHKNTAKHPLFTTLEKYGSQLSQPLRVLVKSHLGENIQPVRGMHDARIDAISAMKLYKKYENIWDTGIKHHGPLYKSGRSEARRRTRAKKAKQLGLNARLMARSAPGHPGTRRAAAAATSTAATTTTATNK
jgi:hypothetical protein